MLAVLMLAAGPAFAGDQNGIAIVKKTKGRVTVKRHDQVLPVQTHDNLQAGDILITGLQSQVGIIFADGSVLFLEENSFLRIKEFVFKPLEDNFKFKLYMKKGTALFESGKIGKLAPKSFEFEIPKGTIGIRGTKFLVEVK
ncbi:MAG: FecR domain-containing protein [Deltaproteobacteria bacterium]|nr:FecR domain-containing protein [Deltaproteobacteria bacterium]